jgi:hypothetical protein
LVAVLVGGTRVFVGVFVGTRVFVGVNVAVAVGGRGVGVELGTKTTRGTVGEGATGVAVNVSVGSGVPVATRTGVLVRVLVGSAFLGVAVGTRPTSTVSIASGSAGVAFSAASSSAAAMTRS